MRRWLKILIPTILLAGGAILCAVRWQAWFGMPAEPIWTGDTLVFTFPTFMQENVPGFERTPRGWQDTNHPESLDILVLGDMHNKLFQDDYDTLAARQPQIDLVAQCGDWLDRGYPYYYQLLLREWTPSQLKDKPVIVCPGNHEYSKGLDKQLSSVWLDNFTNGQLPIQNGPKAVPGVHYYVDFPNIRFIVLDTNQLDKLVYVTRLLTWLRATMNSANGRYVVVLMHHPVRSAAKHRVNPWLFAAFRHVLGEADLVIAGHDHSYVRRQSFVVLNTAGKPKPQKSFQSPDTLELNVDSVVHTMEPVYGVISVPADGNSFSFHTYRLSDGELIDAMHAQLH